LQGFGVEPSMLGVARLPSFAPGPHITPLVDLPAADVAALLAR